MYFFIVTEKPIENINRVSAKVRATYGIENFVEMYRLCYAGIVSAPQNVKDAIREAVLPSESGEYYSDCNPAISFETWCISRKQWLRGQGLMVDNIARQDRDTPLPNEPGSLVCPTRGDIQKSDFRSITDLIKSYTC